MAFVYHGKIERLATEVERIKPIVDKKYLELFGKERFDRLEEVVSTLLGPTSYFDDRASFNRGLGTSFPSTISNRMMLAAETDTDGDCVDGNGRVKFREVDTGVAFYISEEGTANTASKNILMSYLHEFDHFVPYALQKVPLGIVVTTLTDAVGIQAKHVENRNIVGAIKSAKDPKQVMLCLYLQKMMEVMEKSNRILDNIILAELGMHESIEWRGKERGYVPLLFPPNILFMFGYGGDPFYKVSDKDVVEQVMDWEQHFQMEHCLPFMKNLADSIQEVKVNRIPFDQFVDLYMRKEQ